MTEIIEPRTEYNAIISGGVFRRKAMVFLIYLVFGPPIGGLATILGFFIYAAFAEGGATFFGSITQGNIGELLMMPVWIAMMSLWGYFFGGAQAALTGLILAAASDRDGRFGYDRAEIATFPPSLLAGVVTGEGVLHEFNNEDGFVIIVLALVSVAASLAVRFLFRARFRVVRAEAS